jgi:hypothetical protein
LNSQHAKERYTASSAAVRRGFDEKSGERRGDQPKKITSLIACFRRIFAAKLPELMPANQLRVSSSNPAHAIQTPWRTLFKPS